MCHVLKSVTEGRDLDDLAGPGKKEIEDLGRCVDQAQPSLPNVTSGVRTVHRIEAAVLERANFAQGSREHHPGSTKGHVMAWRTEIWEILEVFDVSGS